jgi:cytoskeletal protein CcmA (bactofilin family)
MQVGNTKYGYRALQNNNNGSNNSAFGSNASENTDSSWNTSVGAYANMLNVSGISNVAVGTNALLSNTSGSYNTALGTASALNNKSNSNTSVGSNSMQSNTTGAENIALGVQGGYNNTTGFKNIFVGNYSGLENIDGSENVFLGHNAGLGTLSLPNNYSRNTFLGANTKNSFGHNNATAIGHNCDALVSDGITLGSYGETVLIPGTGYMTNTSNLNKLATIGDVQIYESSGIILVEPCVCATTVEITLTSYFGFIDGVVISDGDRVLVRCQNPPIGWTSNASTNSIDNGIYVYKYNDPFDASFSRVPECDASDNVIGQSTLIRSGTLNDGTLFKQVNDPAIVGDNSLSYIALATFKFSLGDGLEFIGNELNVKSTLTDQNGNPFLTDVTMLGRLNVDGSLNVVGEVSLNSKLSVGGDVSLNSKLRVGGDVSLNSKLTVGGDVSLNSKLTVVGDVSLNSKLRVVGDVSLNGKLQVMNGIDCTKSLVIRDSTPSTSGIVEALAMIDSYNHNKLSFALNCGNGSYNTIVKNDDVVMVCNGGDGQDAGLSIIPYDNSLSAIPYSNGLRITNTTVMLGSGGQNSLPTHRLTSTATGITVDGNMSVTSDISINGIRIGKGRNDLSNNTFIGYSSGTSTITGNYNTSIGYNALNKITSGDSNICVGHSSGLNTVAGSRNTFTGYQSGYSNEFNNNCYFGYKTGFNDVSGSNNSFFGYMADVSTNLPPISNSTAIGANAKVDASNQIVLGTSSERVKIPGKMWCVGDASFSHVNITTGSGIRFSDNTVQVTAYNGTAQSEAIKFTTTTSGYVVPPGVYKIDLKVVGRGGECGANSGGSGGGAQTIMLSGSPISAGYVLTFNFVDISLSTGYVEVVDTSASIIIAKAYNGGKGGDNSGGAAGIASGLTTPTAPTLANEYGTIYALKGTNGQIGPPTANGLSKGSPSTTNTSTSYGNGQLNSLGIWPTGVVILTCYYV